MSSYSSTGKNAEYADCQAFCRPNWVPHPLTSKLVLLIPLWVPGGRHTHYRGGGGGGPNSDEEDRHSGTLCILQ